MSRPWRPLRKSENPWISHTVAAHKAAGTVPADENIYNPNINDDIYSYNSNNTMPDYPRERHVNTNISERIQQAKDNIKKVKNGQLNYLYLENLGLTDLSDLPGLIQVLDRLVTLSCASNPITDLPNLRKKAPMLKNLYCMNTLITELPQLPDSLTYLNCRGCGSLNDTVIGFNNPNGLRRLPRPLPPKLEYLNCSSNALIYLPPLPSTLLSLIAQYNKLKILPELPHSLRYLYVDYNQLRSIPKLPLDLQFMQAVGNPLEPPFNQPPLNILNTRMLLSPTHINTIRQVINDYWDHQTVETMGAEMVNPESYLSAGTGKRIGYGFPVGPNVTLLEYLNISKPQNKKSFSKTRANLRTKINPNPLSNVNTSLFNGGTRRRKRSKYTRRN